MEKSTFYSHHVCGKKSENYSKLVYGMLLAAAPRASAPKDVCYTLLNNISRWKPETLPVAETLPVGRTSTYTSSAWHCS